MSEMGVTIRPGSPSTVPLDVGRAGVVVDLVEGIDEIKGAIIDETRLIGCRLDEVTPIIVVFT